MFPLGKIAELPPKIRLRKIARILQALELDLSARLPLDAGYVTGLLRILGEESGSPTEAARLDGEEPEHLRRRLNGIRHGLLKKLGAEPSEWDLVEPRTGDLDRSSVPVHPIAVYLEELRSPFNVGSIFRTSEAFGVERILLSPRTPLPTHPRASKTARGAAQGIPWEIRDMESL